MPSSKAETPKKTKSQSPSKTEAKVDIEMKDESACEQARAPAKKKGAASKDVKKQAPEVELPPEVSTATDSRARARLSDN